MLAVSNAAEIEADEDVLFLWLIEYDWFTFRTAVILEENFL